MDNTLCVKSDPGVVGALVANLPATAAADRNGLMVYAGSGASLPRLLLAGTCSLFGFHYNDA
jgi:hypothetical protein